MSPTIARLASLPGFWLGRAAVADSPRRAGEYLAIAQALGRGETLPDAAIDGRGRSGCTEGEVPGAPCRCCGQPAPHAHMAALLARAEREGVEIDRQTW